VERPGLQDPRGPQARQVRKVPLDLQEVQELRGPLVCQVVRAQQGRQEQPVAQVPLVLLGAPEGLVRLEQLVQQEVLERVEALARLV